MNTTVPWNLDDVAGRMREGAHEAALRSDPSLGDGRDEVAAERPPAAGVGRSDRGAEMKAIAAQLARIADGSDAARASAGPRPEVRAALREAVADIMRRQTDLDRHGEAPSPSIPATRPVEAALPGVEAATSAGPEAGASRHTLRESSMPLPVPSTDSATPPPAPIARETTGPRRASIDLSAEVKQTFARFSRDLRDAIQATDARPTVAALDREVQKIGRAVDGLGAGLPATDAIARIGEQTREMRDLLKSSTGRSVPLDALERHVASLETRIGRLAEAPAPAPAAEAPPGFHDTMAEVRALLDGFNPSATMAALETRLDDLTDRIERGLAAQGPSSLIEGLSRRVDEIHASLRSQLAESAIDTRPLEGLVRGLSDRINEARASSTDYQQLEAAMRDVAAKIDGTASAIDPRAAHAIEGQLVRLADRLDRSEASLKSLDGVEQSLGQLFSQFEVTRQVAIDAAETAARTAARDTLRAALQNPSLSQRAAEVPTGFAEQVTRGLDDLRSQQDQAERRTQTTLSDIRATVERLASGVTGHGAVPPRPPADTAPRRRAAMPDASVAIDPADMLIEPGFASVQSAPAQRAEVPFGAGQHDEGNPPAVASNLDADGPTSFIAAARRAAQAAQASVASAAAMKNGERRTSARSRISGARTAPGAALEATGTGTLGRTRAFLAQRRRPILLGLAALVLVVGALEVVQLSVASVDPTRAGRADTAAPARVRAAAVENRAGAVAPAPVVTAQATVPAVLPPAASPARPPLPAFVAGPAKAQVPIPLEGVGDGLRSLAAAGDAGAQYEVGLRYADGRGVARDPKQAVAWFEKAAAQGSAPARYRLGSAYEKGVGADRDPVVAIGWYGKAAEAGNIRAMHNLAVMSAEGAAGKPDYATAAQWFAKASTYGVRDSQFNLAILYARGLGLEQSLPQSYTWFAIAAAEGDEDAAKKRDEVGAKLDPKALASAKAAVDAFHAAVAPQGANEVTAPAGGWDTVTTRGPSDASPAASSPSVAKVSQL